MKDILNLLTSKQIEEFKTWDSYHKHSCDWLKSSIGGRLTFSFTPTELGTIIKVTCACGESLNLTEYENL